MSDEIELARHLAMLRPGERITVFDACDEDRIEFERTEPLSEQIPWWARANA